MADRVPLDFDPPVRQIRALLLGVDSRDLTMATPCPDWPVAALLDHLMGLALAFTLAARKRAADPIPAFTADPGSGFTADPGSEFAGDPGSGFIAGPGSEFAGEHAPAGPPQPSAATLSPFWRSRLPVLLADLAIAWKDPAAWTGTAQAGGVTMPATAMGTVAMNELVLHGWDLARATGQDYAADPRVLEVLIEFLAESPPGGSPGLFGPRLPMGSDDEPLSQALSLAGRDPAWRRPRRHPSAA